MEGFDWDFVHTVLKETSVREAVEPLKMTFSCDCSDEKDVLMKFHSRKAPHSTDHCTGESLVARRHSTIPYPVARSASISTPQMQKKSESSLTIPALLRTATDELNHQELVAITEVMKAELERLSKQNHELLMREQSALINVEAALSSVPKKGMFFESKIITVNRTDVEQIQGIANTHYQAVYTFPCLPPSSSLKNVKKKHQKYIAELELEPSVVAHFTHPQTRVTARLPKAAVAAAGGSCAVRLAAQHPHDLIGGTLRLFITYSEATNKDLVQLLNSIACTHTKLETLKRQISSVLSSKNGVNETGTDGKSLLHMACTSGNTELALWLLANKAEIDLQDAFGWTPLMNAIASNHFDTALALLKTGKCNVTIQTESKSTALHYLCAQNVPQNDDDYFQVLQYLLDGESDPFARNNRGETPFHSAIANNALKLVEALLPYCTPQTLSSPNGEGFPPLHAAVSQKVINLRLLRALLRAGANPQQSSPSGAAADIALRRHRGEVAAYITQFIRLDYFALLTDDLIYNIIKFLQPKDVLSLRRVNKTFHNSADSILKSQEYWEKQERDNEQLRHFIFDLSEDLLPWYGCELATKQKIQRKKEKTLTLSKSVGQIKRKNTEIVTIKPKVDCDLVLSLAVIGAPNSGKTTFIQTLLRPPADLALPPHILPNVVAAPQCALTHTRIVGLRGKKVRINIAEISDTSDKKMAFQTVQGILLLIDLSQKSSLDNFLPNLKELKTVLEKSRHDVVVMTVGTKSDCKVFNFSEDCLAARNVLYAETAASDPRSIHIAAKRLCDEILNQSNQPTNLS